VPHVDVNGAKLWVEEAGEGPAVLFVHGGLGDLRLWEPQADALAGRFRCIRTDLRFYGRSSGPGAEWSPVADLIGVLDKLAVERAAIVGLSLGGALALDAAIAHPERVWALAHVAGGVSGLGIDPYTAEQEEAYDDAIERGDFESAMEIDFAIWAPLGADDLLRTLWRATPDARGVPEGARQLPQPPAQDRLGEITAPTLVIVAKHDPPDLRERGELVARLVPGARRVEVDSDHYLTLREPEQVSALLGEFLSAAS